MKKNYFIILIPIFLFLGLSALSFHYTTDDSYISYRYAQNFAEGRGLVFNPSERVEGYSNLLWVLILSAFSILKTDIIFVSKILGILSGVGTILLSARIALKDFQLSPLIAVLAVSFIGSFAGIVYFSTSGMETIFYLFQVTLLQFLLLKRKYFTAGIVCATLIITRPEGIIFTLPLAVAIYDEFSFKSPFFKNAIKAFAIPVLIVIALTVFRLSYYGALLPNTFAAKINHDSPINFFIEHTKGFFTYSMEDFTFDGLILTLSGLGMLLVFKREFRPMIVSVLLVCFFIWYAGGDWMSFARFYIPIIPLLSLFMYAALSKLTNLFDTAFKNKLTLVLLLIPVIFNTMHTTRAIVKLNKNELYNPALSADPHVRIGKYLKSIAQPGDTVAVNEVGAISHYSDLHVIDILGLTDKKIAKLMHKTPATEYADYIIEARPKYILLNNRQYNWDDYLYEKIYKRMAQSGNYRKDREFELNKMKKLILFVRQD
jgi:hypothetical protein